MSSHFPSETALYVVQIFLALYAMLHISMVNAATPKACCLNHPLISTAICHKGRILGLFSLKTAEVRVLHTKAAFRLSNNNLGITCGENVNTFCVSIKKHHPRVCEILILMLSSTAGLKTTSTIALAFVTLLIKKSFRLWGQGSPEKTAGVHALQKKKKQLAW